jgi:hypothetical protein
MQNKHLLLFPLVTLRWLQFTEAVVNLKFDEEPKYEAYIRLFESLCGPRNTRPIQTAISTAKVGQKRMRDPSDEIFLDSTGAPKKKVRVPALPRPCPGDPCGNTALIRTYPCLVHACL